uniref:Uncharacterized protein n=1 Tax=Octopus bimaculoides TaxID=37653 RepID=A0A0L8I1D1_OCTBM
MVPIIVDSLYKRTKQKKHINLIKGSKVYTQSSKSILCNTAHILHKIQLEHTSISQNIHQQIHS